MVNRPATRSAAGPRPDGERREPGDRPRGHPAPVSSYRGQPSPPASTAVTSNRPPHTRSPALPVVIDSFDPGG
ncbi:hypothetical protein San01_05340 [Streptomyces angustmyceticus]|uniref:Uncharacterized protein n=1 Tax=Streptomyces angustmyceticus TaxID=285578 RepID=A0A5J4L0X5_9ACTN|nr:hypothetical protein San01_05340 [Streptomyces angustmyceticus]